jgi:hypothetical protein
VPNTPYSLSYELSGLGTELEGIGCSSCSFELEIMLLDPQGGPVSLGNVAGNSAPDSLSYRNSYTVDDCMVEQTEATVDIGGIALEHIGDYTVVKELRLLSPTAAQAMAEIRNSPIFAGQLAALDSLYSSYGDCEFCTPEDCPAATPRWRCTPCRKPGRRSSLPAWRRASSRPAR